MRELDETYESVGESESYEERYPLNHENRELVFRGVVGAVRPEECPKCSAPKSRMLIGDSNMVFCNDCGMFSTQMGIRHELIFRL